ncbi:MAG: hypothetical protein GXP05_12965 [Alphaproteobacteria bacterium]|nr:hypothetical protein [Alphaproteobacteria bacterium]
MTELTKNEIEWDRHATLNGIRDQGATYQRGGEVASGTLRKMVKAATDYETKGYIGLMILTDGPSYQGDQIAELRDLLD